MPIPFSTTFGTLPENVRIKAQDIGQVPQLTLTWFIVNRSMADVEISGISGDLYVGAWRVGSFEANPPQVYKPGYEKNAAVTVTKARISKGGKAEATVTLFPPIEFWLSSNECCSLFNTKTNMNSFWGNIVIDIEPKSIDIEEIGSVAASYKDKLSNRLKSLLGG